MSPTIEVVEALEVPCEAPPIQALALSPDATILATGFAGYLPCVALWDVATGRLLRKLTLGLFGEFHDLYERDDLDTLVADHEEALRDFYDVQEIRFRGDGEQLAVISSNHDNGNQFATRLEVFDVHSGRVAVEWSVGDEDDEVWAEVVGPAAFAWCPDTHDLVAATFQGDVLRWSTGGRRTTLRPGVRGEDSQRMTHVRALAVRGDRVVWWADDTLETIAANEAQAWWQVPLVGDPRLGPPALAALDRDGVFTGVELRETRGRALRFDGTLREHAASGISWLASLSADGDELVWGDSHVRRLRWGRGREQPTSDEIAGSADRAIAVARAGNLLALSDGLRVWFSPMPNQR
ncbi:MAG: hypothetical protein ACTHU0_36655 [Kofleriaceae bacterium]